MSDPIVLSGTDCVAAIQPNYNAIGQLVRIISTSTDPASMSYIRQKVRALTSYGFHVTVEYCPNLAALDDAVTKSNDRNTPTIIQRPFGFPEAARVSLYPWLDIDGLTLGSPFTPCTPKGIITLLNYYDIPLKGKKVTIIGRSPLVGLPLSQLMIKESATVTVCHSKTENIEECTRAADIIVSATGVPHLVNLDMISSGAVLIDVGYSKMPDGTIAGDIDPACYPYSSAYTPVPGGVGPMTVYSLCQNAIEFYEKGAYNAPLRI